MIKFFFNILVITAIINLKLYHVVKTGKDEVYDKA